MTARRLVKSREHTPKGVIVALAETMFEVMVGARYNIISCESAFTGSEVSAQIPSRKRSAYISRAELPANLSADFQRWYLIFFGYIDAHPNRGR